MTEVDDLYRLVYGRDPEDCQRTALARILDRATDGIWVTADQTVRDLRAVAGAFIFGENVMYSCRSATARAETYRRLRQLIADHPELRRLVGRFCSANGAQRIELTSGRRITFIARSVPASGRGLSVDCVVADEGLDHEARAMAGINLMASPRRQLVH